MNSWIFRISISFGMVLSVMSCIGSESPPQMVVTIPYSGDWPEYMKMPFDPEDTPLSGSISGTLREIPYEQNVEHYWQVYERKYAVTVKTTEFPPESIDSATDWVFVDSQSQENEFPSEDQIARFEDLGNGKVYISQIEGNNFALYDGIQMKKYIFCVPTQTPQFIMTGVVYSSKHGVYFGSSNFGIEIGHEGAQGLCRLSNDGLVERVFWPPSLRRLGGKIEIYGWDITDLEFSSPDRLWAGMPGAVVRLDLDRDQWILFDEFNSPIEDYVDHIAAVGDSGRVRCVCREWREWGSIQDLPKKGTARIVRIEGEEATSEALSIEAQNALNDIGPIVSDENGTLWFMGGGAIWKSNDKGTHKIFLLPVKPKYDSTTHLLIDSSGRFWVGNDDEVWVQKGSAWERISDRMSQPKTFKLPKVSSLGEDPAGRIWVNWEQWPSMDGVGTYLLGKNARKRLDEYLGPALGDSGN